MLKSSDTKKWILVGVGALIAYAQFGPVGVIGLGVVLAISSK